VIRQNEPNRCLIPATALPLRILDERLWSPNVRGDFVASRHHPTAADIACFPKEPCSVERIDRKA